jgi:hypothetical protein
LVDSGVAISSPAALVPANEWCIRRNPNRRMNFGSRVESQGLLATQIRLGEIRQGWSRCARPDR